MTERETIEIAIHCLNVQAEREVCEECPVYAEGGIACREVARTAISALKEIRLYKENGLCLIPEDVYFRQCCELDAYKELGTVEECREAVEKQKPKKPKASLKINPVIDGNGAYVDADTTVYLLCPNCEELVGIEENCDNYCRECGQKIDKESEEE